MNDRSQTEALIAGEGTERNFTPAGFRLIHTWMVKIGQGDAVATKDFLKFIQKSFIEPAVERIAARIFGASHVDEEILKEVINSQLFRMIRNSKNPRYFANFPDSWSDFARDFQNGVRQSLERRKNSLEKEQAERNQLQRDASDPDHMPDVQDVIGDRQRDTAVRNWVYQTLKTHGTPNF